MTRSAPWVSMLIHISCIWTASGWRLCSHHSGIGLAQTDAPTRPGRPQSVCSVSAQADGHDPGEAWQLALAWALTTGVGIWAGSWSSMREASSDSWAAGPPPAALPPQLCTHRHQPCACHCRSCAQLPATWMHSIHQAISAATGHSFFPAPRSRSSSILAPHGKCDQIQRRARCVQKWLNFRLQQELTNSYWANALWLKMMTPTLITSTKRGLIKL